jgi:hypothetical protein
MVPRRDQLVRRFCHLAVLGLLTAEVGTTGPRRDGVDLFSAPGRIHPQEAMALAVPGASLPAHPVSERCRR